MSQTLADLKRVASTSGLYAAGEVLSRGLAFLLLPVYTRYLDQAEYGALELLNAFSGVLFAFLLLGMPSALTKCFHRDCDTDDERASVLSTAILLDLPMLLIGGGLLFVFAQQMGWWMIGRGDAATMVRLVVATAVVSSLIAIVLASFRARERAVAFVLISLLQFVPAMALNIVLVVHYGLGVRGVLWGNLISCIIALPVALWVAGRYDRWTWNRRLVAPLVNFGALLIPVTLASWVIDLSDRYVLRLYEGLEQIAIYGVGYKIGMVLQMALVWPFQLAWPAVSFSISRRDGHQESYAKTLTYFSCVLAVGFLGLALVSRPGLPVLVGEDYRQAVHVVPWVALAYAFNGFHFCLAPGIHITGNTRFLPIFSVLAAALNLGLNFLTVPRFGPIGAAWSTAATFFFLAAVTWILSQRVYPVQYELGRLWRIVVVTAVVYGVAVAAEPAGWISGVFWHAGWATVGFPVLLLATGFLDPAELAVLRGWLRRR